MFVTLVVWGKKKKKKKKNHNNQQQLELDLDFENICKAFSSCLSMFTERAVINLVRPANTLSHFSHEHSTVKRSGVYPGWEMAPSSSHQTPLSVSGRQGPGSAFSRVLQARNDTRVLCCLLLLLLFCSCIFSFQR